MQENVLRNLYVDELKDLYDAENQLVKALTKMAKAATSPDLKAGFENHLEQTKEHVERLEKILDDLSENPKGKHCKGMEGLIEEGKEMIEEDPGSEELDAGLIGAAQRVEHYEIAGYGCVRTYAKLLGHDDAASTLQETLDEEKETTRLGKNLAKTRRLDPAAVEASLNALRRMKQIAAGFQAREVRVIATCAVREARDGQEFCRRAKDEIGLDVEVISGDFEARLAFYSVARNFQLAGKNVAIADIGAVAKRRLPVGDDAA